MDEPKKCPFCGGEPFLEDSQRKEEIYVMQCTECFGEGPIGWTKAEAIAAWNHRASPWVAVEDGLPEKTGEYLVLPHIKHCPTLWYQDGWYWYDENEDTISETIGHWKDEPIPTITHWMPIPPLPEQEK